MPQQQHAIIRVFGTSMAAPVILIPYGDLQYRTSGDCFLFYELGGTHSIIPDIECILNGIESNAGKSYLQHKQHMTPPIKVKGYLRHHYLRGSALMMREASKPCLGILAFL